MTQEGSPNSSRKPYSLLALPRKQRLLTQVGIALATSLVALILRALLEPFLFDKAPLLVFILPIILSAFYGGLVTGLLATTFSAIIGVYFFVPPHWSPRILELSEMVRVTVFICEGILISCLCEALILSRYKFEQIAASLRESEEQYRLLVEGVQDYAIFALDPDGRITSWNAGAQNLKGYGAGEIVGRHFSIFYTPEDIAAHRPDRNLQTAAETGSVFDEGWRVRKNGSRFWANVLITALRNQAGQLQGYSKIVRDVTERQLAEEALQHSEARLRRLVESNIVGVFFTDFNGQISESNDAFLQMLGYTPEDLQKGLLDWTHLTPPEYASLDQQAIAHLQASGKVAPYEKEYICKDGQRVPILLGAALLEPGQNQCVCFAVDLTQQKLAESALRRSAQRLEALNEIDRAILAALSLQELVQAALIRMRRLVQCRDALVVLFDWEHHTVVMVEGSVPTEARSRFTPESPLSLAEFIPSDVVAQGETACLEYINQTHYCPPFFKSQSSVAALSCFTVPLVVETRLIGELNLLMDEDTVLETEQQAIVREVANQLAIAIRQAHLRDEIRLYTTELEQRVRDRTLQLQEANQELEAFAYSVSHDLRAPLRAMQGFTQALLEDYGHQLDALGQEYAERIEAAAQRMDTLIQDLLDYSRLSRSEIESQRVDLNSVFADVLSQMEPDLTDRGAAVDLVSPLPLVWAHRLTLVQVLSNLLGNAIKFVEPEIQPQIQIWAEEHHPWLRLWIQDNGIGIAPEHQERIFRVFERLHGVESYPGTGIGLAIVQKGVERMGGRVGVESQPGQGSRFWIDLLPAKI